MWPWQWIVSALAGLHVLRLAVVDEEAEQRRVAAAAASARAFRRRCVQALSAVGMCVLLLLLHRAGRLPLRLQRLLAALLPWLRRR